MALPSANDIDQFISMPALTHVFRTMPAIPIGSLRLLAAVSMAVTAISPVDAAAKGCCGPPPQVNTAVIAAAIR
jgi:hypothetical protein